MIFSPSQMLSSVNMDNTINQKTQSTLERFSEILLDPEDRIGINEWLSAYNSSEDDHVKFILIKCLPRVESMNERTLLQVKTHCSLERCNLLIQIVDFDVDNQEILKWMEKDDGSDFCVSHCLCSFINLAMKICQDGTQLSVTLLTKLFERIDKMTSTPEQKRCALSTYLDLLLALTENESLEGNFLEDINRLLLVKLKENIHWDLQKITSQVQFNRIYDCLLLRKTFLLKLIYLAKVGPSMAADDLRREFFDVEHFLKDHFDFSSNVFIDLFLEEDAMILKCLTSLMKIGPLLDESMAHEMMETFLGSIDHDERVLLDWLTSDQETADLTLRLLLIYFKMPSLESLSSAASKSFFRRLIQKITSLWTKGLFPYNPKALLKYAYKF